MTQPACLYYGCSQIFELEPWESLSNFVGRRTCLMKRSVPRSTIKAWNIKKNRSQTLSSIILFNHTIFNCFGRFVRHNISRSWSTTDGAWHPFKNTVLTMTSSTIWCASRCLHCRGSPLMAITSALVSKKYLRRLQPNALNAKHSVRTKLQPCGQAGSVLWAAGNSNTLPVGKV